MEYTIKSYVGEKTYRRCAVINYNLEVPIFERSLIASRINKAINSHIERIIKNAEGTLYVKSCKRFDILGKYNCFTESKISTNFQVMRNSFPLLSLFVDIFYDMSEDGQYYERIVQNWDLQKGIQINFSNLISGNRRSVSKCMEVVSRCIESFEKEIGTHCNPNWREHALNSMKNGRFYLTDDGIALWFKYGSITSGIWGIPTLHFKASELEGIINKKYFNN